MIIILATIVIFEGFGATESAEFARFTQEFSDYQERVSQEYRNKKTDNVIDRIKKKDSEIYKEIAGTTSSDDISALLNGKNLSESLRGTKYYLLELDKNFYDANESVYLTDKGEIFTLPGYEYEINGETRYYVTSGKYYMGDGTVVPGGNPVGNQGTGGTSTGEPVEMTGEPTVEGIIAVGDYVEYLPDSGEYTNNEVPEGKYAKDYYLGHTTSGTLITDTTTRWRVVRINDGSGEAGEVLITPEYGVNSLKLIGGAGYINSVRALNYVCRKLYSNNNLGTKARSMRVEDLDYNATGVAKHYAYYSNSTTDAPTISNVTVNGITYEGIRHGTSTLYTYGNIVFWDYDAGTDGECIKEINLNGHTYSYATPIGDKPVLVTEMNWAGGSKYSGAKTLIGGSAVSWLASTYTKVYNTGADFHVCEAHNNGVYGCGVTDSYGFSDFNHEYSRRLRPLVTLGSGLHLSVTGEGTPGSASNPWTISKAK